jgi:NAD(P)-dependent dehydrogenase (short-subunit alcohol dehydrogenase family)
VAPDRKAPRPPDRWTRADIPDQTGRVAVVTGANTGIGLETARALASRGAHVVLACRSRERGEEALRSIGADRPAGEVELLLLDLASLASVRAFAQAFSARHQRLDLLVNNAGIMVPPFGRTEDGFELQIGINFLGHFALTGLLLDRLRNGSGARIVTVSSIAHRMGRIDVDTFTGGGSYRAWRAYGQSKLADLMFALELQRRLAAADERVQSLAAHPGFTRTELQRHHGASALGIRFSGMTPAQGALPTLYAATSPDARGGDYIGPGGLFETRGYPARARISSAAQSRETAVRLWHTAERLTGTGYLNTPAG